MHRRLSGMWSGIILDYSTPRASGPSSAEADPEVLQTLGLAPRLSRRTLEAEGG